MVCGRAGIIRRLLSLLLFLVGGNSLFFNQASAQFLTNQAIEDEVYARLSQQPIPCTIVIFGATGDLTARKLLPALYNLAYEGNLSEQTAIIGFARKEHTNQSFRKLMGEAVDQFSRAKPKEELFWQDFQERLFYHQADLEQDEGYANLQKLLQQIDKERGVPGNRLYYLATSPRYFTTIIKKIQEHGLLYEPDGQEKWSRIIFEKPFGTDLESAFQLQQNLLRYLDESQVYLIDHYLGKEGVQNLFTLRFESGLLEPMWNAEYIDHVQITLSEEIGIGSRAHFWEETGALRDIFQNHLMQLIAIVAMEPPRFLCSDHIHAEKIKLLNAIRPFTLEEMEHSVIRGQYGPGIIRGENVPGYKQEADVSETSTAETFMAAKLFIDNPRWQGVPFYIRGGKRLAKQTTEIAIIFKKKASLKEQASNALFIRIQPNPGIFLRTLSKVPTLVKQVRAILFGYCPDAYFKARSPEAYEKLIYDCINGDNSLYTQAEEHLAAWRLLTPILDYWKSSTDSEIPQYEAGSWGPPIVDRLLNQQGHEWQLLEN
ncbi:glucose-6-phosphate dehydrogenase [Candidatus Protochlamydia phocaeensis]|uniref:glucose-6-phosphate dehydrogenase n=1 Tax=Candidatus Protochlamydia phocaeensis TaxID=1414722 RepID=UPI0009AD3558|nr:glucose-6-phosphate dehydrogenase [Candidatus Protochlamydia phocaeensis]